MRVRKGLGDIVVERTEKRQVIHQESARHGVKETRPFPCVAGHGGLLNVALDEHDDILKDKEAAPPQLRLAQHERHHLRTPARVPGNHVDDPNNYAYETVAGNDPRPRLAG